MLALLTLHADFAHHPWVSQTVTKLKIWNTELVDFIFIENTLMCLILNQDWRKYITSQFNSVVWWMSATFSNENRINLFYINFVCVNQGFSVRISIIFINGFDQLIIEIKCISRMLRPNWKYWCQLACTWTIAAAELERVLTKYMAFFQTLSYNVLPMYMHVCLWSLDEY